MTACKSIDMMRSLISTIMTVNQFMITDYTELLHLVDLAAGQSGVLKDGCIKKKKEAMPRIILKKLKTMTPWLFASFVKRL